MKPFVLAIDDDEFFRKTIDAVLKNLGLDCVVVASIEEFKLSFKENEPSLILIDLQLADNENGLLLVEDIRAQAFKTPILVASGVQNLEVCTHALELGANDFILKPFDKRALAFKLAQFLHTDEIEKQSQLIRSLKDCHEKAKVNFTAKVIQVDELGIKILSPHLIPKGSVIELSGPLLKELEGEKDRCLLYVSATEVDSESGNFLIYSEFEGTETNLLQSVRRWIHQKIGGG